MFIIHGWRRVISVEDKKITSLLDEQLSNQRYKYPSKAFNTVKLPKKIDFIPNIPDKNFFNINVIKTQLPGIMTFQEVIKVENKIFNWR